METMQKTSNMRILTSHIETTCSELEVVHALLDMDDKLILEVGCGAAEKTRAIASEGRNRRIIATEVDKVQLEKNHSIDDLPNVEFIFAGAEQLPLENATIDVALLFKSLHHVPIELMDQSFTELHRVLKPGGLAYVSEPICAGNFNDVLKLFHDEQAVRAAAFEATKAAVQDDRFALVTEIFFNTTIQFEDFDDFENRVIRTTHSNHQLSSQQYVEVKQKLGEIMSSSNGELIIPIRVDLLKKDERAT